MKWCDRTLIRSLYCYGLCLTDKQFARTLEKYGLSNILCDDERLAGAAATTSFYTTDKGKRIAIVKLGLSCKSYRKIAIQALLVHEATHIWQAIREEMSEDSPSSEFEAYSVQRISQNLMEAYEKLNKKSKRK